MSIHPINKHINLRSYKIIKIVGLVDLHSLCQLLHLQIYHSGLKLLISIVNRNLSIIIVRKNLQMTQKIFMH